MAYSLLGHERDVAGSHSASRLMRFKPGFAVSLALGLTIGFLIGCLSSSPGEVPAGSAQNFMDLFGDKLDQVDLHPADLGDTTLAAAYAHRMTSSGLASKAFAIPPSPLKRLALTAIDLNNRGVKGMAARAKLNTVMATMDSESKETVEKMAAATTLKAEDMAGITGPMGFFDPLGLSADIPAGRLLFYREVELKHGRLGMLASLGLIVGEQFHPLFGGNIDVPGAFAFQQTPLQTFWQLVIATMFIPEFYSVLTFQKVGDNGWWKINEDHTPGDFNFDPLSLKPEDKAEYRELENKELNNGRLAMLAAAGILAQELATGKKLF